MEGNTDTTAQRQAPPIARIAWFLTFALPLVLAALLLGVKSAQAAPTPAGPTPFAFEEEFEGEFETGEGEFDEAECEEAEEEFEAGELSKAEVKEICTETEGKGGKEAASSASVAPEECLLRSAHAHAVTSPEHDELKLTVGYTAYEPVGATVEIRRGSDRLGSIHRHLDRIGVLRLVKSLGKDQAPHQLIVQIRIPASPPSCGKFLTQKIPVSQAGHS